MRIPVVTGLCFIFLSYFVALRAEGVAPYAVMDLGTLGGSTSWAWDINEQGHVVGTAQTANGDWHAFVWRDGVMNDLASLDGSGSCAYGINNTGLAVGQASQPESSVAAVWRYTYPQDFTPLPQFGPAHAVNDAGHVVGEGGYHWKDGELLDVCGLGGGNNVAMDINESGVIVGTSNLPGEAGPTRAFVCVNAVAQDLGTLGGTNSWGHAINNNGEIVGSSQVVLPGSLVREHPFLYREGTMLPLGAFEGDLDCLAFDINDQSQVVGDGCTRSSGHHACLWEAGSMYDLNDCLRSCDSQWEIIWARGINNSGQIAGMAEIGSEQHAILLTPIPEPATLTLLALGALGPLLKKRRIRFALS